MGLLEEEDRRWLRDVQEAVDLAERWTMEKQERQYEEKFTGLFVNKKSGLAHLLHIGWDSNSSRCNYWYRECGGGIGYAGGDTMLSPLCHGPGEKWIDVRDFEGEPKVCDRCQKIMEKRGDGGE